jgi:hypothetical protein
MKYKESQSAASKPKIHLIGHSYGTKLLTLSALNAIELWNKDNRNKTDPSPIESLLLFNAAFEPWELYNIADLIFDQKEGDNINSGKQHNQLRDRFESIPRKAFVYSNTDFANGLVFDISQIMISNSLTKFYTDLNDGMAYSRDKIQTDSIILESTNYVADSLTSFITLGSTLAYSPLEWIARKMANMPFDFYYHINNNDTFSDPDKSLLIKGFNAIHYFFPLDKIFPFTTPIQADKMGIFRSSKEALGRAGLYRMGVGRPKFSTFNWLNSYYSNDSEVSADIFCQYSKTQLIMNNLFPVLKKEIFYSFDGSQVLSSKMIGVGSHSDLRIDNESTDCENGNNLSKQESIFNFTYNFTKKIIIGNQGYLNQ